MWPPILKRFKFIRATEAVHEKFAIVTDRIMWIMYAIVCTVHTFTSETCMRKKKWLDEYGQTKISILIILFLRNFLYKFKFEKLNNALIANVNILNRM